MTLGGCSVLCGWLASIIASSSPSAIESGVNPLMADKAQFIAQCFGDLVPEEVDGTSLWAASTIRRSGSGGAKYVPQTSSAATHTQTTGVDSTIRRVNEMDAPGCREPLTDWIKALRCGKDSETEAGAERRGFVRRETKGHRSAKHTNKQQAQGKNAGSLLNLADEVGHSRNWPKRVRADRHARRVTATAIAAIQRKMIAPSFFEGFKRREGRCCRCHRANE